MNNDKNHVVRKVMRVLFISMIPSKVLRCIKLRTSHMGWVGNSEHGYAIFNMGIGIMYNSCDQVCILNMRMSARINFTNGLSRKAKNDAKKYV